MTIAFDHYPAVNQDSADKTLLGDIITHCRDWKHFADASSRYTTAHECTHGINNDLRLGSGDWQGKNGFYLGQDRAIILDEPKIRKRDVVPFIPESLRSARYNLYVLGQSEWDSKPLYLFDEGTAYINGAWAAIELKEQENYVEKHPVTSMALLPGQAVAYITKNNWGDHPYPGRFVDMSGTTIVDGEIEFIAYMTAVLLAADKAGQLTQRLIDFSRWLFRHASNAYHRSKKDGFPAFDVQDRLWATMRSGADYSEQRAFLAGRVGYTFPDSEVPEDDDDNPPWFA